MARGDMQPGADYKILLTSYDSYHHCVRPLILSLMYEWCINSANGRGGRSSRLPWLCKKALQLPIRLLPYAICHMPDAIARSPVLHPLGTASQQGLAWSAGRLDWGRARSLPRQISSAEKPGPVKWPRFDKESRVLKRQRLCNCLPPSSYLQPAAAAVPTFQAVRVGCPKYPPETSTYLRYLGR